MASFLDTPKTFNPYVKTLPVEAMVGVGNLLQAKFDQGLQKVQGAVDHIATLPVAREVDKQYVQSALNSLKEGIQGSAIADFSNSQLVNQIGGAASKIVNDPIIQKSISSAMRVKSGYTQLEEAKKNGKGYNSDNEQYFNNRVQEWMGSQDLQQGFGESYTPYIDIIDEAMKLYKEMPDSENIQRDAFRVDPNEIDPKTGRPALKYNSALLKGKSAERVQDAIDLVMQRNDVQKQLHITGSVRYQGKAPVDMYNDLTTQTSAQIEDINGKIKNLQGRLTTDNSVDAETVNTSLTLLRNQATRIKEEYNNGVSILNSDNPESLKALLTKQQIYSNFIGAFSSEIAVENPLWKGYMEETSAQLAKDKFIWEQFDDNRKFGLDEKKFGLEVQKELRAATEKAKKPGELGYSAASGIVDEKKGMVDMTSFTTETKQREQNYDQELWRQANLLAAEAGISSPAKENSDGSFSPNVGTNSSTQYISPLAAWLQQQKLLMNAAQGMINGQPATVAKSAYQKLRDMKDNIEVRKKTSSDIDKQFLTGLTKAGVKPEDVPYHLAAIVYSGKDGKESAEAQLRSQFGDNWELALGIHSTTPETKYDEFGNPFSTTPLSGDNLKKLKQAQKNFNTNLKGLLEDRDLAYKNAQGQLQPSSIQFKYGKTEEELDIKQKFDDIVRLASAGKSVSKGDADKLSSLLAEDTKTGNKNTYYTDFDETTGMGTITVRRGTDESETISNIPRADYFRVFPELQQDNSFNRKFRDRLELNNWKSTDRFNDGRKDAYILETQPSPDPATNYSVQYHLIEGTSPGTYRLRLWVANKAAPEQPIIDGRAFDNNSESAAQMDRAQVMGILEWLKNPTNIKFYIDSKSK